MKDLRVRGAALLGAMAVVNLLVACGGGSDEEANGDGDIGGSGSTLQIECVPADGGDDAVCFNDTDCDLIDSEAMSDTAGDCLKNSCLGGEDEAGCTADCIVDEIGASPGCASCYGSSAACSGDNCLTECYANRKSPECLACQLENGCIDEYLSCSGLTRVDE